MARENAEENTRNRHDECFEHDKERDRPPADPENPQKRQFAPAHVERHEGNGKDEDCRNEEHEPGKEGGDEPRRVEVLLERANRIRRVHRREPGPAVLLLKVEDLRRIGGARQYGGQHPLAQVVAVVIGTLLVMAGLVAVIVSGLDGMTIMVGMIVRGFMCLFLAMVMVPRLMNLPYRPIRDIDCAVFGTAGRLENAAHGVEPVGMFVCLIGGSAHPVGTRELRSDIEEKLPRHRRTEHRIVRVAQRDIAAETDAEVLHKVAIGPDDRKDTDRVGDRQRECCRDTGVALQRLIGLERYLAARLINVENS